MSATEDETAPVPSRHKGRDAANDPFFQSAVSAAKTRTFRAAMSAGLSHSEREDLYQEILLDILERKQYYDPERGSPGTFTGLVSANRTAEYLKARKSDKQNLVFADGAKVETFEIVSIDRVVHGTFQSRNAANDELSETQQLEEFEALASSADFDCDLFTNSNTLHDVQAALAYMSDEQTSLFQLLAFHQDLPTAAKASGMSSATFYRRVADMQMHLRMFGIRSAA